MTPENHDCTLLLRQGYGGHVLGPQLFPPPPPRLRRTRVEPWTVPSSFAKASADMCWVAFFAVLLFLSTGSGEEGKKQAPLPQGVTADRNIEYANVDGISLTLDVYRPFDWADLDNLPVVIWVHGGGWTNGSKDRCPAAYLAQDNFAVVSINYRLVDQAQWPAQINDCYEAVRWVRKNAKKFGFGDKIGVWGGSAGGHLVALMGTRYFVGDEEVSSKVQAVCDFYGPSDLLTMPPNMLTDGRTRADIEKSNGAKLLGKAVMDVPDLAYDASALHKVTKGNPPFLIMHGAEDPGVPVDQSKRLHEKLQAAGVESELVILPGAKHGGPEFKTPEVEAKVKEFFRKHLQ